MYYVAEVDGSRVRILSNNEDEGYFTLDEIALMPDIAIDNIRHTKSGVKASVYNGMDVGDLYVVSVRTPKAKLRNKLNGHECTYLMDDVETMVRNGRQVAGVSIDNKNFVYFEIVDPDCVNKHTARAKLAGYKYISLSDSGELLKYLVPAEGTFQPGSLTSVLLGDSIDPGYNSTIILDDRIKKMQSNCIITKNRHFSINTTAITSEYIMGKVLDMASKWVGLSIIDDNRGAFFKAYSEWSQFERPITQVTDEIDDIFNKYAQKIIKSELREIPKLSISAFIMRCPDLGKVKYLNQHQASWGKLPYIIDVSRWLGSFLTKIYRKKFITYGYVMAGGYNEEIRQAWISFLGQIGG